MRTAGAGSAGLFGGRRPAAAAPAYHVPTGSPHALYLPYTYPDTARATRTRDEARAFDRQSSPITGTLRGAQMGRLHHKWEPQQRPTRREKLPSPGQPGVASWTPAGSSTQNVLPRPGPALSAQMRPPAARPIASLCTGLAQSHQFAYAPGRESDESVRTAAAGLPVRSRDRGPLR